MQGIAIEEFSKDWMKRKRVFFMTSILNVPVLVYQIKKVSNNADDCYEKILGILNKEAIFLLVWRLPAI